MSAPTSSSEQTTGGANNNNNKAPAAIETSSSETSLLLSNSSNHSEDMVSSRRKELFGDCALIEIIHLHDCLRGALKALEMDVHELAVVAGGGGGGGGGGGAATATSSSSAATRETVLELERRVASRFKVIWSVFRSHSSAEDEYIWPALSRKTAAGRSMESGGSSSSGGVGAGGKRTKESNDEVIVQEEYEEDHADEERMFSEMDALLSQLRETLLLPQLQVRDASSSPAVGAMTKDISARVKKLSQHLHVHLEKEETKCMPLVVKHLTKSEIHELVGNIMGKRSAETIASIMTMAVQNLDEADREEMIKYMKQSMAGTFFDRWLQMAGWLSVDKSSSSEIDKSASGKKRAPATIADDDDDEDETTPKRHRDATDERAPAANPSSTSSTLTLDGPYATGTCNSVMETTSQADLEKLIRAVASNPALTPAQKNTTIQGLRDSVWKQNQRQKQQQQVILVNEAVLQPPIFPSPSADIQALVSSNCRTRKVRVTPPFKYYKKTGQGKIDLVWTADSPTSTLPEKNEIPLFSAAELAPTYHDGAAGAVLGCPHYARACKLRHPKSGRLYTCRLCCQQQRELPTTDADEPLDRYEVTEVMCMACNTLQPAEDRCINPDCESRGKPFARYFCRICHLYDDGSRPIFHCPYCNICKVGLGLGQDFRHCMRCNACVALSDSDHHCIPQKLEGDCPICHDSLFESTEPLRGLRCGHVMHLACFTNYRRGHNYTCPLCMRSMEDMSDYFSMLDTAVRMQPMPLAYLSTMSNIYCQDCGKTGQVQYHFVGQKCLQCGSYNTREMGRVHNTPSV